MLKKLILAGMLTMTAVSASAQSYNAWYHGIHNGSWGNKIYKHSQGELIKHYILIRDAALFAQELEGCTDNKKATWELHMVVNEWVTGPNSKDAFRELAQRKLNTFCGAEYSKKAFKEDVKNGKNWIKRDLRFVWDYNTPLIGESTTLLWDTLIDKLARYGAWQDTYNNKTSKDAGDDVKILFDKLDKECKDKGKNSYSKWNQCMLDGVPNKTNNP